MMGSPSKAISNKGETIINQVPIFSSGLEISDLVINSDLLHLCIDAITHLHREIKEPCLSFSVKYKVSQLPNCTILAFATSQYHLRRQERSLVSPNETRLLFDELFTKQSPNVLIHKAAGTLFDSLHEEIPELKNKFGSIDDTLIITGHALGGSISSLFTLWLLQNLSSSATKKPLCITFGAPLTGNNALQQAILQHSTWNSCFLHVVSNKDRVPRLFIEDEGLKFNPFGTFLMCSAFGSTFVEDPVVALELLMAMRLEDIEEWKISDYSSIVDHLKTRICVKGSSHTGDVLVNSLRAEIILQLEAIGIRKCEQQQKMTTSNTLMEKLEKMEETSVLYKKKFFDPVKKLNDVKVTMAQLEWYKKMSKANDFGYYDSYKNQASRSDREVTKHKRVLTNYWIKMVEEAERIPQKEGASFRTRWLFAGTNYRRMVEPLDIAEYYREKGRVDYKNKGRSRHYIQLEKWLKDEAKKQKKCNDSKKLNGESALTEDSCFWANVEEAIISCWLLKDEETSDLAKELSRESLIYFEKYAMKLVENCAISPEIFLAKSSFMQWWKEYEGISVGNSLTDYMKTCKYKEYANGCLSPSKKAQFMY